MAEKPKMNSAKLEQEIGKVEDQLNAIDNSLKAIPINEINNAPIRDYDPQTKISTREANKIDAIYLKPERTIGCRAKFNDKFRSDWNNSKEYVRFIAENNEIIGESIEIWTKPFAGVPYEFWRVPVNKPVMGPRHLAEQIATRQYRRLVMKEDKMTSADGMGTYYGSLQVEEVRNRLYARPVGNSFISMAS